MDALIYILLICITVPLVMMLPVLKGQSRILVVYMIIGIFVCFFAATINSILLELADDDIYYTTTNITPAVEEILKAMPVLYFALIFDDKRSILIQLAFATGVGFAVLENTYILVQNIDGVTIFWALIRGFASGLMHGICTMSVGLGISFVKKKRKLFLPGTFALLVTAIIYHATYNTLVQSDYAVVGYVLPILTYVPLITGFFGGGLKKRLLKRPEKNI